MNLQRLAHAVHETETTPEEQAIVSTDIAKAFDSVKWPYLMLILKRMGFGPKFRAWVELLYTRPVERVRMGSVLSGTWQIERVA